MWHESSSAPRLDLPVMLLPARDIRMKLFTRAVIPLVRPGRSLLLPSAGGGWTKLELVRQGGPQWRHPHQHGRRVGAAEHLGGRESSEPPAMDAERRERRLPHRLRAEPRDQLSGNGDI